MAYSLYLSRLSLRQVTVYFGPFRQSSLSWTPSMLYILTINVSVIEKRSHQQRWICAGVINVQRDGRWASRCQLVLWTYSLVRQIWNLARIRPNWNAPWEMSKSSGKFIAEKQRRYNSTRIFNQHFVGHNTTTRTIERAHAQAEARQQSLLQFFVLIWIIVS